MSRGPTVGLALLFSLLTGGCEEKDPGPSVASVEESPRESVTAIQQLSGAEATVQEAASPGKPPTAPTGLVIR